MKKLLLLFSAIATLTAQATVFYVNPSHPSANDANWGDTPENPWLTLKISSWSENDTIMVANGVYTLTEKGYVNKKVTVIGQSKSGVIIQGEDDMSFNFNMTTCRFFSVGTAVEATFKNMTLKNLLYDWHNGEQDATATYGGVFEITSTSILNLKNVDIKNIKIYGNGGNAWGAAIMNRGTVNADSCAFENCYATQGGAMYVTSGAVANLSNCKFAGNGNPLISDYDTYRFGGAICLTGSATFNADRCYFDNNFTEKNGNGGAIMIRYEGDKITTLNVTNSTFSNNKSAYAGSVLFCGANTAATATTELNITFKNCVFYKNAGNLITQQYNNTISLPAKANYVGTGRFIFVNNSLFGNYNSAITNTRSVSLGDTRMKYYIINNLMNDNEVEAGVPQAGTYGMVLEGTYNVAPTNITTMVLLGNVFNATGGALGSINFPDLDATLHPESKNSTGQKLIRTQQQTTLKVSANRVAPYLDFTSSNDSVSVALNHGINEYMLDDVNIVPQTDILGNGIADLTRDAGAWEMSETNTGITKLIADKLLMFPIPFTNSLNFVGAIEKVEIYNANGQQVLQQKNPGHVISTTELKPGLYMIKLTKQGSAFIQKAVKN